MEQSSKKAVEEWTNKNRSSTHSSTTHLFIPQRVRRNRTNQSLFFCEGWRKLVAERKSFRHPFRYHFLPVVSVASAEWRNQRHVCADIRLALSLDFGFDLGAEPNPMAEVVQGLVE